MAGFLNLMVLTMHGQVTNHLNDFGELNSNEKIQFDLGLPYNPRQAMDTSSDANTPLLLLLKLNKTLSYIKTQLEEYEPLNPSVSNSTHRIVIVSLRGSGSTLLTEILSGAMATYHHHEPLLHATANQLSKEDEIQQQYHLKNRLRCKNLTTDRSHLWHMQTTNPLVGKACWKAAFGSKKLTAKICSNTTLLDNSCALFPLQLMTLLRSRLSQTRYLLQDPQLNSTKIVLLVRDPRATLNWRSTMNSIHWNHQPVDRDNSAKLCDDLNSDLDEYVKLLGLFPDRIVMIKYESLIAAPQATFESLFNFVGLPFTAAIERKVGDAVTQDPVMYGTFTGQVLNVTQIHRIEHNCATLLRRLDYPLSKPMV